MYSLEISSMCVNIQKKPILNNISLTVPCDKILCILGQNGSGKSTLLRSILGLLDYTGSIKIHGVECKELSSAQKARTLSYVPQIQHIPFPFSLFEVVLMGRFNKSMGFTYSKRDRELAFSALEMLDIGHLATQSFQSLSGGQKQLGLIARALTQDSSIIILDEPVSALDLSYSFKLLSLLRQLSVNKTIILTSHHPEQCFIADFILMVKEGKNLYYGSAEEALVEGNINKLYNISTQRVELPNGGRYFCP